VLGESRFVWGDVELGGEVRHQGAEDGSVASGSFHSHALMEEEAESEKQNQRSRGSKEKQKMKEEDVTVGLCNFRIPTCDLFTKEKKEENS
jgi:hypothetical protein